MTATAIQNKMNSMIESRGTSQLLIDLEVMEATAEGGKTTPEARMVKALISDTITARLGLDDLMEDIYMDIAFEGTYLDAIHEAIQRKEA